MKSESQVTQSPAETSEEVKKGAPAIPAVIPGPASDEPDSSDDNVETQLQAIDHRLAAIAGELEALRDLFDKKIRYDSAKEKSFDKLYEKMQQSEGDFLASLKKDMIRSLLLLYDSMLRTEGALCEFPEAQRQIADLGEELLNILDTEDVEPMGNLGERYDRENQQAVQTIPVSDPAQDGIVDRIVREGFRIAGKVLRPQGVVIRRFEGKPDTSDTNEGGLC